MITDKMLNNPKELIELIDRGVISTRETENAYRDEIHINKQFNRPLKLKRLEMNLELFLNYNKQMINSLNKKNKEKTSK